MNPLTRRVSRLEDQFGTENGDSEGILIVASRVGLAMEADSCVQILRECGFVPTRGFGVVNLYKIPEGLKAGQIKLYLRKHGAELCTPQLSTSCR